MSAAKFRAYNTTDAMKGEEKIVKPEREGQDILDNVIRQAIGKDPFLSFSRAGDSPVRWIQLLQALDQQGSEKTSRSLKVENYVEGKHPLESYNGAYSFSSEMNGTKESVHSLRGSGNSVKGTKSTSEQMQSLKIPEAVVAFAQAAAKANGEPKKYLPGWPLSSPSKVQLQKCSKCSQEFCSAINHRRHIRVHRRSLNTVKDSSKTRNLLAEFWDKLSPNDAKELLSFQDVAVEGVTGSSVIRALSSWIRKPGLSSLPQKYVKAGVTLLDIVNTRPPSFPMTSQELFSVLDDASEKTFLSAGTAVSLQKYVLDSEAGKNALEMKNLIACTSFLLEQILVKAWVADKDAEALRCQKLLVEEEEAAQKRHAELLERKRLKKLRQKEQKAKELSDAVKVDSEVSLSNLAEDPSTSGSPSPSVQCDPEINISDESLNQGSLPFEHVGPVNLQLRLHEDIEQSAVHRTQVTNGHSTPVSTRRVLIKQSRNASNGFCSDQVPATKSLGFTQHGNYRDPKAGMLANSHKVWTRKPKPENQAEATSDRVIIDRVQPVMSDGSEVLIGSISVALGEANGQHQLNIVRQDNLQEKLIKSNSTGAAIKLWRPVGYRKGYSTPAQSDMSSIRNIEENADLAEVSGPVLSDLDHLASCGMDDVSSEKSRDLKAYSGTELTECRLFSSEAAKAFLAQRWKEAIAADHVKLIVSPDSETSTSDGTLKASQDCPERIMLRSAENRMAGIVLIGPTSAGVLKPKFRPKHEKNFTLKYIPKQRSDI